MTKVSFISAYYNRGNRVAESVKSLLEQNYHDYEVIIVNDASKDNTLEELRKFDDPRLKIIDQQNTGLTTALRNAVDNATGDYIAVHGSGDISLPDRLQKQAAVLDSQAKVGVVSCYIEELERGNDNISKHQNGQNFYEAIVRGNLFSHGEVMFRRNIYDQVGGYRSFFTYAQDRDLWLRMSQLCDYYIVPEVLYQRFHPENAVSRNPEKQLIQACMASFAVQCAEKQKAEQHPKGDLIDRFGKDSIFLKEPSEELARRLAGIAITHYDNGDIEQAEKIASRAVHESRRKKTMMIHAAIKGARNKTVGKHFTDRILERWRKK